MIPCRNLLAGMTASAFLLLCITAANAQRDTSGSAAVRMDSSRTGTSSFGRKHVAHDALVTIEQDHIGDVLRTITSALTADLGSTGQPAWVSDAGTSPFQTALLYDGTSAADLVTGISDPYLIPSITVEGIDIYPMHRAWWYGGSGILFAAETREGQRPSPKPSTRLFHREGPYDYLLTDVFFSVDPRKNDRFRIGVTRRTIGTTGSDNSARFVSQRAESWDLRASYTVPLGSRVFVSVRNHYTDQLVFMNGGEGGIPDAEGRPTWNFPPEGIAGLAEQAFNPIEARFLDPSIRSRSLRNTASLRIESFWTEDSAQATFLETAYSFRDRQVNDYIRQSLPDSVSYPSLDRSEGWNLLSLTFRHQAVFRTIRAEAFGSIGKYSIAGMPLEMDANGLTASAGASLGMPLGAFAVETFARIDRQGKSTGYGIGASAGYLEGSFDGWVGAARTGRGLSLIERALETDRTVPTVSADAREISSIVEAGSQWTLGSVEIEARCSWRRTQTPLVLVHALSPAPSPSMYARVTTVREIGESTVEAAAASLRAHVGLGPIALDEQIALLRTKLRGRAGTPASPGLSNTLRLGYDGSIIRGTLRLKAGGSVHYRNGYMPSSYDPSYDIFSSLPQSMETNVTSYTDAWIADIFLFATIKETAVIHVVLHNVFDARYITTLFYPMPDRGIRFGVDWTLFD
ncbi:MAG: hypothetical protein QHI48_07725 [Bacteroidota bacterium]|nr:hypothetical protein [Bacteroidota bacterium]